MRLGELLAEPRVLTGAGDDVWPFLAGGVPELGGSHPLRRAVERLLDTGAVPRPAPLTAGVGLLDLGNDPGDPGLVLCLPPEEGQERPFGHATWVSWGLSKPSVNLFLGPALGPYSADLLQVGTVEEIHEMFASTSFLDSGIETHVLVEHVLTPLTYRIYPDTPITEVQHLMLRRGLSAVPVVGANHELLGLITVTDVLDHTLPGGEGAGPADVAARDAMTRSVLCVSEDEGLLKASRVMITRKVSRLPVVRDGELIGFLERGAVMRAFA